MQNVQNSEWRADDERPGIPLKPKHRYRVRRRRKYAKPEIIWATNDLDYAWQIARELNRQDAVRSKLSAWVEEGCARQRWVRLAERTLLAKSASTTANRPVVVPTFHSGDSVEAILLEHRTRKGGWKARLLRSKDLVGPITNSDVVLAGITPGTKVVLRIEAVDDRQSRVQLRWCDSP